MAKAKKQTLKTANKTKKTRLQYDRKNLEAAFNEYNSFELNSYEKLSIRRLSKQYNVPETTLRDRIKGRIQIDACVGHKPFLTGEEEQKLAQYLLKCSECGVGKTKSQVKHLASSIFFKLSPDEQKKRDKKSSRLMD